MAATVDVSAAPEIGVGLIGYAFMANPTPPRRLQVRARHPHKQSDIGTYLEAAKIPPDPSATSTAQEQRHQRQTTRHSGSRRSVAKVRYA
jgi:hypothetical protein